MLTLLIALQAPAGAAGEPALRAVAVPRGPDGRHVGMVLDGRLDEPSWRLAPPTSGFRQREPLEGAVASDDTEVRVVFDHDTLYVGVLARDREPKRVIARILERDRILRANEGRYRFAGDDAVLLLFDPFRDRRNAFVFGTNANGAEYDALIADEGETFNADWRGVWRVAAQRVAGGWSAEFAIPFRSLRYPASGGAWGFNVYRMQRRKNEETLWAAWSRQDGGFHRVSRAGALEGLHDLPRKGLNLEVRPFALAGADQDAPGAASEGRVDAGLDLKWEVRPGLVLDATLNPDFSQVESDEEQVNLTRFSLFLPEKREFFLENAGIFEFGERGSFETPPFLLFFSRRIGLDEDENEVPVLGGGRLTGRVGGQTLGFMDVYTGRNPLEEPANFAVGRVKRDVGTSSYVGAMVTDKRRQDWANTAGGLDASLWLTGSLNLQAFVARTQTTGEGGEGTAARVGFDYETDPLGVRLQWIRIDPETDAQMGFITRTDVNRYGGEVRFSARPSLLGLRRVTLDVYGDHFGSIRTGQRLDVYFGPYVRLDWNSGDSLSGYAQQGRTYVDEAFDLADRLPVPVGDYEADWASVEFQTAASRPVSLWASGEWQRAYGGRLTSHGGGLGAALGAHLSTSLGYERSTADLPSGSFVADVVSLRLGYAFSTRFSASAYVQWNSLDEKLLGNFRVVYRYRPGSEVILALDEDRGTEDALEALVERHLALKLNYLVRF
jgi:hypothetical protein